MLINYVLPLTLLIFTCSLPISHSSPPSLLMESICDEDNDCGHLAERWIGLVYMALPQIQASPIQSHPSFLPGASDCITEGCSPFSVKSRRSFLRSGTHRFSLQLFVLKVVQPALAAGPMGFSHFPCSILPGGLDPSIVHDRDLCSGGQHAQPLHCLQLGRWERVPQIRWYRATRDLCL